MEQLLERKQDTNVFTNAEFGNIHTITINDEVWFLGKEITDALGYENGSRDINRHVYEEDRKIIQNYQNGTFKIPNRGMTFINESGVYALIFSSKLDSAKRFKHWVTSEVLPSIRKTGTYSVQPSNNQMEKILAELANMKVLYVQINNIENTLEKYTEQLDRMENSISDNFDAVDEQSSILSEQSEKLEMTIDNMTLSTRQQEKIHEVAKDRVNFLLGGAHNATYKKNSRMYFINLWNGLKSRFHCGSSWKDLNPTDFDKAIEFIGRWEYQG